MGETNNRDDQCGKKTQIWNIQSKIIQSAFWQEVPLLAEHCGVGKSAAPLFFGSQPIPSIHLVEGLQRSQEIGFAHHLHRGSPEVFHHLPRLILPQDDTSFGKLPLNCLVGGFNMFQPYPPEKWWSESQIGSSSQLLGKIHVPNHQPVVCLKSAIVFEEIFRW